MARRQRGSIIERPGGYCIKYRDQTDKQKFESGFVTKGAAQARLNEVLAKINAGTYIEQRPIKFAKFAEEWIANRMVDGSTESGYTSIINVHLVPQLGKYRVCDLTLQRIQALVTGMVEDGLASKTIHNCITLLRGMLTGKKGASAMRLGYIAVNPTLGLEVPKKETKQIVPPTDVQVWNLIEIAQQAGSDGYPAIYIDAFSGLRRNELLALRFSDIDWLSHEICVTRAIKRKKATDGVHKWQWLEGPPKSKHSIRRVAATQSVLQMLSGLKALAPAEDAFVLRAADGSFINPDTFDEDIVGPILDEAKIPDVRFHDLRHFFASMLIAQGESPKYVCDQMGHSSIKVTFDTYGHLFPQAKKEASAKFEATMQTARQKLIGSTRVAKSGDLEGSDDRN